MIGASGGTENVAIFQSVFTVTFDFIWFDKSPAERSRSRIECKYSVMAVRTAEEASG